MTRIYVTKLFIDGPLKGLTYHDSVTGSDVARLAKQWAVGTVVRKPIGGSPYRVIDASFQNYAR